MIWGIARVLPWRLIGIAAVVGFVAWHYFGLRADRDAAETLAAARQTKIEALTAAVAFERQARAAVERMAAAAVERQAEFDDIRRTLDATAPALDAPIPAELDAVLGRLRDARTEGGVHPPGDPGEPAAAPSGP